jgi:hypothetical protein
MELTSMEKVIGKHYAGKVEYVPGNHCSTVSVGICPVLRAKDGSPKLGTAVVRIKGLTTEEGISAINTLAEFVASELDDDYYNGPKILNVDSSYARRIL